MNNKNKYLNSILFVCVISIFIGLFIGLFQVGVIKSIEAIDLLNKEAVRDKRYLMIIFLPALLVISGYFVYHLIFLKNVDNDEDPNNIKKRRFDNFGGKILEYFLMFFTGFPVSSPDVLSSFSRNLSSETRKLFKDEEEVDDDIIHSSGFGGSLISPLASIGHFVENKKYKITFFQFIKILLATFIVCSVSYAIKIPFHEETYFLLNIQSFKEFSWDSLTLYFILGIIIFLLFAAIYYISYWLNKIKTKSWYPVFQYVITGAIILVSLTTLFVGLYLDYKAWPLAQFDGYRNLTHIQDIDEQWWIMTLLFTWLFYVIFLPYSKFKTGLTLPTIMFGSLLGLAFVHHGIHGKYLNNDEGLLFILITMFGLYGCFTKRWLTAFLLIIPSLKINNFFYALIPFALTIFPSILGITLLKMQSLPELVEEVIEPKKLNKKHHKGRK